MYRHPSEVHVGEEVLVGGEEDGEQRSGDGGGGCALVLRADALQVRKSHCHVFLGGLDPG